MKVALSMFVCIFLYISIGFYWSNPGWSTIFYFTLVQKFTHPLSDAPALTLSEYGYTLLKGIWGLRDNSTFLLYVLFSVYSIYLVINQAKIRKALSSVLNHPYTLLTIVGAIFVASHFILFPVAWDRFFVGPYLISSFSLLVILTECLKLKNSVLPRISD